MSRSCRRPAVPAPRCRWRSRTGAGCGPSRCGAAGCSLRFRNIRTSYCGDPDFGCRRLGLTFISSPAIAIFQPPHFTGRLELFCFCRQVWVNFPNASNDYNCLRVAIVIALCPDTSQPLSLSIPIACMVQLMKRHAIVREGTALKVKKFILYIKPGTRRSKGALPYCKSVRRVL